MEYGNHFVREAICTFRFIATEQIKDYLDYTWSFYQVVKENGFTQKQRRPVVVNLKLGPGMQPDDIDPTITQGTIATVFTNADTGYAIILDENLISFNCLGNYRGWDIFVNELIRPYLAKYFELNVPQRLQNAQMAYINDVPISDEETLGTYLAFIPVIGEPDRSIEIAVSFQGHYQLAPNVVASLQASLNPAATNNEKRAIIECNSIATVSEYVDGDKLNESLGLANQAHANARLVFESVATTHFKHRIK